jgi:hypothetical protein
MDTQKTPEDIRYGAKIIGSIFDFFDQLLTI